MKRLLSLTAILLAFQAVAWAQPSLLFPSVSGDAGQTVCVDVRVKDFTDILSMDFSLRWDPNIIQFERVEGFGLPNFGTGNFNTARAAEGTLSVSWLVAACSPTAVGVTTPDGTSIFRLCFKALGNYGDVSEIILDPNQNIRVTRVNACPNNIGMFSKNGLVSVGVRALTLYASQETAAKSGDLVCVDFKVNGFDNLTYAQFTVQWDTSILEFANVQELDNLINLSSQSFGTPNQANVGPGKLTVSWSYVDPMDPGITLADSTTIFQACFRAVGDCEKSSNITFTDSPTPIEFGNSVVQGFRIKSTNESGKVSIGDCDPVGLRLFADCGPPVNPNAEVCVKISTAGFQQVREFAYNLEWNEKILQFLRIQNINGSLPGFDQADFNQANVSNGVLGVNWSTTNQLGSNLPGGTGTLYEVCFKVIGVEGGSPVDFTGPAKVVTFTNPNLGINPSNCAVEIIKPEGIVMTLTDEQAPKGDTACVDVSVDNFNNILSYQFSLTWEPNHMEFVGINNINLPEASLSNFGLLGIDGGALTFEWEPSKEYSVPDNTVIFQACFKTNGNPEDCDVLQMVDNPIESEAISTTSNGNNIGVVSQPAEVCILFPEGFFVDIDSISADTGTVACLPFRVASFDNITGAQFPVSWEPSALQFVGVQNPNTLPGLTDANFNITSTGVGVLTVNWTNPTPVNIADSTTIFELCYTLVGDPGDCYEVRIGEPDPVVTTANGGGSLLSDPGEVCIRGRLNLLDTIIRPVSCPGSDDGEITLVVTGGRGPLGYTWETTPQRFGPTASRLPVGKVVVTVFDNSRPALTLRDTFDIPLNADLPTANAGEDRDFTCTPPIVQLQGQGSQGTNFKYKWRTLDGQLTPNDSTLTAGALAPGTYFLEVTNNETGCVARDTMRVVPVNFPVANAGTDRDFSCLTPNLQLDGSGSTTGTGVRYRWTSNVQNGGFVAGTDTLQSPTITAPGTYVVAVTNTVSGCIARDSVIVRDIAQEPNANAGQDVELPCGDDAAAELVSQSNNPEAVNVEWLDVNGQVLSDSIRLFAKTTGTYLLRVTNPTNGCSATDTVAVKPNTSAPNIALDSVQQINCLVDTLTLNAAVSNATNFTFEWAARNGGQFVQGTETALTPRVAVAGTYEITVRDTATKCVTTDLIVIEEDKAAPTAEAGSGDSITCTIKEVELNGTGSSSGADFSYQWSLNGNTVAADTLRPKVTVPGTYYLAVTNKINGCIGRDSVQVDSSVNIPQVIVPLEELAITCQDTVVTITANTNANFTIEWTALNNGVILSGQNTATITTNTADTFQVKVTNPVNGCVGENEAVVINQKAPPIAAAGADQQITCTARTVTLNGNSSSVGADFTYQWRSLSGGANPSPNNAPQVTVTSAGTYALVVTNTRTACVAVDTVVVNQNDTLPALALANIDSLTCRDSVVTLDATATRPNNVNIQWNSLSGGTLRPTANPLIFEVTQGGNYEVLVTNPDNGCVAKDTVAVVASDSIPQISLATPAPITCTQSTTTLDAGNTRLNGAFTAEWKALSGGSVQTSPNNPLRATANGAGKYQLTITVTQTGCTASQEIDIAAPEFPVATASAAKPSIGCGENTDLNSDGSSTGTGINYRWSVLSGTGTIANPTAQTVQVDKAGNYQLVVTNTQNGCADTATVSITFNVQFAAANAGSDTSVCSPSASLTGNLPMGTTGQWKSLAGIAISNPTQPTIAINNLSIGDNRFVWALSATGCGEYSADTVAVKVETAPTAADDAFTLKAGETQAAIAVTGNDNLSGIGGFAVSVLQNPVRGGIAGIGADGRVAYIIKAGIFGEDEFKYQLCSEACPTFCDSATVSVLIEEDPNFVAAPRINAITPNGDGLNEQLIFDELLINPQQYPDNELVVFNRWGDIVYTARPYANNWDGTNDTGQNLPEGTYYYILRLNISEGVIIRGDVTIVR